ncbi:RNA-binding S4 domain-containing protein [Aristophania vespae]|uniref:RNA-binding S4 domain-containing protein n=1 Tax=Aristophania vespae TaxID=2697033 RepID=A0A6P1ND45_9PROT|nr:S4 domain-containing protein [Aristophania vespae]QHI95403.1 RNA-binding S4 domain-containing protein [Aristophania vespae]
MDAQRLDLWFFYARLAKSRNLCSNFIEKGTVRLNGQRILKAHSKVRVGDILTFPLPSAPMTIKVWQVLKLGNRRGPAPEAMQLYLDIKE